uniref:Hormone-sensitive lipase N-terminal domain-containing protein n=1 Tax=Branchiostoma floridae TaxID=7739 RepID=C3Y101_BRAFL|eukprot:XP_002610124.1 hypothetical protein BRAFLDRAFT_89828 [Branchiostoma floridae]
MAAVKADSTTEEKAAAPESKPAAESVRPKEHGHRDKRKKADVSDSAYNCWFKTLRSLTANNSEYFERHKTQYSSRFSSAVCILQGHADAIQPILEGFIRIAPDFDVDESTPGNGYRSLVKVVGTCIRRIIHVQRKVVNNRDGLLFQSKHYCQELEAYASVLCQLRAIMDVAQKVLAKSKHGQLFPEEKLFPEFLFEEAESLDKECFYGRCVGFQFCSSMQPIFHTISTAMASFAEAYSDHDGQLTRALASLLNSGKYAMNPELRARTIVGMCDKADISFCKAFWNITEEGPLQHMSGFLSSSVNVNKVFHIPAMPFEMESSLEDGELVTITPPCSQTGPGPVQVRLICFENREGQPEDISSPIMDQVEEKLGTKKKVPAPKSDALIIHIHGGGFVAQSSKSHEVPDGVLAAYTPFLVRYTPSPSRLLCMMDPLLPMGILSRCIAAYAGLKEKKPGEDVSSSSSTTSSTPQLSTPEHNFSSARLVFDPSPTEPKRSGEGAAAPKLLFTNTSGGLCEVHTPSPSPPGGDGPVQTGIPVLTVETETAVIQGKQNTEPTVDNLKEPHFEDIALSPYEEDSGDSEWSLTDKQTEVDSPSGVSDEKSPEEGSEGMEKDRAAEDDPNRPSSLSLPSLPSLDEISMAISKMTESKPEEVVLPSEPVHSPTSISHVTRYRPSPILNNPYMSPLLADDELLKGLPPVYLVVS